MKVTPVILSGGSGTRLWPLSRKSMPKQFVRLHGDRSLFDVTLERMARITAEPGVVVANEEHRFLVAEQLRVASSESYRICLEPCARNTAPAIAVAALQALESDPEAIVLVAPADHVVGDDEALARTVSAALPLARAGRVVTFGVRPTHPETGYGYIRADEHEPTRVAEFVEKPSPEVAEGYLADGNYLWNSGMFLVSARTYLAELERHAPAIHAACAAAWAARTGDGGFTRVSAEAFFACPSESIDNAVMERTDAAGVVPLDCEWSDLGSWDSVWSVSDKDGAGNATNGDVVMLDSSDNYVNAQGRVVALIGCKDLVVVDSGDAVLVADRSASQDVKGLVAKLRARNYDQATTHARVYRPWGDYEGIDRGDRYQVKRIVVKPGEVLSLQKHHHRAEHWIVVRGVALVTCGEQKKLVNENESTYIPLGEVHRMENPGKIPLELIEVQSGSYLGEDDIVRLEDKYGRRRDDSPDSEKAPLKLVG